MPHNLLLLRKLVIIAVGMFAFGYALVPMYKAILASTPKKKTNPTLAKIKASLRFCFFGSGFMPFLRTPTPWWRWHRVWVEFQRCGKALAKALPTPNLLQLPMGAGVLARPCHA